MRQEGTGELLKFCDKYTLYEERAKWRGYVGDEDYVRGAEEGAADYGTRGRYDTPKLWFSLFLLRVLVCCVRARRTEVDTSAGDAKRG